MGKGIEIFAITKCYPSRLTIVAPEAFEIIRNDCLYKALRRILLYGKFLGIVPLQGLFRRENGLEHLRVRYIGLHSLTTFLVALMMVSNLVFETIKMAKRKKSSAFEIARSASLPAYYLYLLFGFLHIFRNSNRFINLLKKWRSTKLHFVKEDTKLEIIAFAVEAITFISTTVHILIYFLVYVECSQDPTKSYLQNCYELEFSGWAEKVSYNPILAVMLFSSEIICWYIWSYAEVIIIVIARAFYFKFHTLVQTAECWLEAENRNRVDETENMFWTRLTKDHDKLIRLMEEFAKFLSPMIFAAYAVNIYLIGIRIIPILTGGDEKEVYFRMWSLVFITGRVWFATYYAAKVNESAILIKKLFRDCPNEYYSLDVQRAVQIIESQPNIGFHGLGCFYITKSFFLTILSTLFTLEIVLLTPAATT